MWSFFLKYSNVLVEKPLSLSMKQVNKLESLAKIFKNKLFVDYPFIFSGSIKMIKSIQNKLRFAAYSDINIAIKLLRPVVWRAVPIGIIAASITTMGQSIPL